MNKKKSIIIILLIVLFGGLLFGFLYRELNKMEKDNESSKVKEESNYEDLEKQLNEKYALYNKDVIAQLNEYNLTCAYKINVDDKSVTFQCLNSNNKEIINSLMVDITFPDNKTLDNQLKDIIQNYEKYYYDNENFNAYFIDNYSNISNITDKENNNSYLAININEETDLIGAGSYVVYFIDKNGNLVGKSKEVIYCQAECGVEYFEEKYNVHDAKELNDDKTINLFVSLDSGKSDSASHYKYSISNGVLKEELIEEK